MKKSIIVVGLCSLAALTACQNNAARNDIYEETGNTINVNDQRSELYHQNNTGDRSNMSEDFGYVRHQKSPIAGDNASSDHYVALDREKLADIIGKFCTDVPSVNDVSTLVTDEEVIIVYDTNTDDRAYTADQVKKMAMSVVPRWYNVYVSDDIHLRGNVESYATMDANSRDTHFGIDKLIQEVKKSPQGKSSAGDANLETSRENNL